MELIALLALQHTFPKENAFQNLELMNYKPENRIPLLFTDWQYQRFFLTFPWPWKNFRFSLTVATLFSKLWPWPKVLVSECSVSQKQAIGPPYYHLYRAVWLHRSHWNLARHFLVKRKDKEETGQSKVFQLPWAITQRIHVLMSVLLFPLFVFESSFHQNLTGNSLL